MRHSKHGHSESDKDRQLRVAQRMHRQRDSHQRRRPRHRRRLFDSRRTFAGTDRRSRCCLLRSDRIRSPAAEFQEPPFPQRTWAIATTGSDETSRATPTPAPLGLFEHETYDDLGPGASIAICDFSHGNPGFVGGGLLANEFIRLPYQFASACACQEFRVGAPPIRISCGITTGAAFLSWARCRRCRSSIPGAGRPQGERPLGHSGRSPFGSSPSERSARNEFLSAKPKPG